MTESPHKDRFLTIRTTPDERIVLRAEAQRRGVSQTQLVKDALMSVGVTIRATAQQQ
jgi:hypothetical protein